MLGLRSYSNSSSCCFCFHGNDTSLSLQGAQALRTGRWLDSVTSQGELPPHLPEGVEGGTALNLFSIISALHSPRALHPYPTLPPGMAGPLGMCLGRGHLGLCSSYITASINTGNAVLSPRHDYTRCCWMKCAPSRKRPQSTLKADPPWARPKPSSQGGKLSGLWGSLKTWGIMVSHSEASPPFLTF